MQDANGLDDQLPVMSFHVRQQASRSGPRLGELHVRGRAPVATPSLIASTSRGVVPHVTPDNVQKHTAVRVTYAGLEDFLEKSRQNAPIFNAPQNIATNESILRAYTSLPDQCVSILGPRRVPRVSTSFQNTNNSLAISTSFGFASLDVEDYNSATWKLKPDISTTVVDLVQEDKISRKRIEKSADRTHAWLRDTLDQAEKTSQDTPLFASIPPLEPEQQSFYLSDLKDEFKHQLSGVCIYEPATAAYIPEALNALPVLNIGDPRGPHDLLDAISLGIDLVTTPFITATSEAGIAMTFKFHPATDAQNEPLGVDMWTSSHATDLSPLAPSCPCYACSRHHKAYLHHLLQAKEMLAWTLLQIHNFHIVNCFLDDVRTSIASRTFDEHVKAFKLAYETEMPQKTGEGPRIRGYQTKSVGGGELKKNPKAYNRFEEQARKLDEAASGVATPAPDDDAETLQNQGLGQKLDS